MRGSNADVFISLHNLSVLAVDQSLSYGAESIHYLCVHTVGVRSNTSWNVSCHVFCSMLCIITLSEVIYDQCTVKNTLSDCMYFNTLLYLYRTSCV